MISIEEQKKVKEETFIYYNRALTKNHSPKAINKYVNRYKENLMQSFVASFPKDFLKDKLVLNEMIEMLVVRYYDPNKGSLIDFDIPQILYMPMTPAVNSGLKELMVEEQKDDELKYIKQQIVMSMIMKPSERFNGKSLKEIIDHEIREAAINYGLLSLSYSKSEETGLNLCLPEIGITCIHQISMIVTAVLNDVERTIIYLAENEYFQKIVDRMTEDVIAKKETENNSLESENKRILEENQFYKRKNEELERQISQINTKNDDDLIKSLYAQINKLEKEKQTLIEEQANLKEDYKLLKDLYEEEPEAEDLPEEITIKNDMKILFIMSERTQLQSNIQKEFPNAIFTDNLQGVLPESAELVAFVSDLMGHKLYYKYKSLVQKDPTRKYIHLKTKNIDRWKREIWESLPEYREVKANE